MKVSMTISQKKRAQKHKKIIDLYNEMSKSNPNASRYSKWRTIAAKVGYSISGVRSVTEKLESSCAMDG